MARLKILLNSPMILNTASTILPVLPNLPTHDVVGFLAGV